MSRLGWRRRLMKQIQKENSTSVASNAHGEKYRKPKPTNSKPFRFRTDERRMFKKKAHAPLKEITLVRTPGAKSTSKHQNVIQVYLGATNVVYAGGSYGGRVKLGLRSGIILCNAINKVQTGAVPKVTLILRSFSKFSHLWLLLNGMGEPLNKSGSLVEAIHVMTGSLFHLYVNCHFL
ncbi:hypothetical protein DVH24_020963 [Malus domestica]|uniref:Uncharacterized protein n=1 Tax=Malus domestica TaxID=3750 RepID=A0A498J8Y3_MALDO|nr:hypothetical protein DVH24_020963 [Malus domestica]